MAEHQNELLGRCYELSAKYVMQKGGVLVHGYVVEPVAEAPRCIDHAWVESLLDGDEMVFDTVVQRWYPKVLYYGLFQVEVVRTYTQEETAEQLCNSGHYGPWHEIDRSKVRWWPRDETSEGG